MFLTANARRAFTKLRQAFVEAPIFNYFDLEHHIQIGTEDMGYAIDGVFSQLTSDDSSQWYLIAFFFRKMILDKT